LSSLTDGVLSSRRSVRACEDAPEDAAIGHCSIVRTSRSDHRRPLGSVRPAQPSSRAPSAGEHRGYEIDHGGPPPGSRPFVHALFVDDPTADGLRFVSCPPRASVMSADRPRGEMPASVLVLPDGSVRALLRRRPADHSRGRTASRPRRSRSRGAFAVPLMTQRQSTLAGLPGHGFMRILAASLSPVQRPACGDNQTTAPQTRLLTLRRLSSASFSPGQSSISAASRYEHIAKASCSSGRASDSSARDLCTQRRESPGDEKEAQRYADLAASLKWDGDVCRESLALRRRSCFSATRLMDMATTCPASVPRRNGK
jgi:hypothetical protein